MATIQAHPDGRRFCGKKLGVRHKLRIIAEAIAMNLFNGGNVGKKICRRGKSFFPGNLRESGIYHPIFLIFVVLRAPQQTGHIIAAVHGIGAVYGDIFPA